MATLIKSAPPCFAHAFLWGKGNVGHHFIARGRPDLSKVYPGSNPPDWDTLAEQGAPTALRLDNYSYVEVQALRGAHMRYTSNARTNSFATGTFLFPAGGRKPLIIGAFAKFQQLEWFGDHAVPQERGLSIACVGRSGRLVLFDDNTFKCKKAPPATRAWFAACIAITYAGDKEDDLAQVISSIEGATKGITYGVRRLFKKVFGSGAIPGRSEAPINYYKPGNDIQNYGDDVPLRTPDVVRTRSITYVGYNGAKNHFVDLNR